MARSDTRAKLIEVVSMMLGTIGETDIRLADVARKARVKEATIFYHFKDRSELIEEAHLERYRSSYLALLEPMRAALKFSDSLPQWESAIFKVLTDMFRKDREMVRSARVSVIGAAQTNKRLRKQVNAINHDVIAHITALFEEARDRGWAGKTHDDEAIAWFITSLVFARTFVELSEKFEHGQAWDQMALEVASSLLLPIDGAKTEKNLQPRNF